MKLLLAYLILLHSIYPPIVVRHDKPDNEFLVHQKEFPNVVQLNLKDATGIVQMEGTFIRKDWIITAAHGLNSVDENQNIKLFDSLYNIKEIAVYPEFEGFEHDIALIQIDREVSTIYPTPLYKETNELNQLVTIVGRGWSGTGKTGLIRNDQKFRRATNKIDSVSTNWIKFRFDEPENPNATEFEGISGSGDSGGPAFITYNGQSFLAGVSSNQLNEQIGIKEGHYGVIEYYTKVSFYVDWIENVINGKQKENAIVPNTENDWGFPESEIGKKATDLMNAIASKHISDQTMESLFYKSFRESFDLKGFVQGIADNLNAPKVLEIKKARKNVIIYIVESEGKRYLMQLEADKRDDYMVGGLIYKKAE